MNLFCYAVVRVSIAAQCAFGVATLFDLSGWDTVVSKGVAIVLGGMCSLGVMSGHDAELLERMHVPDTARKLSQ